MRPFLRIAALSLVALLAGYGPALATPESEADAILASASARLADVQSLHFTLDIEGDTYIDDRGTIRLLSAEGDLARPDKVAVEFRINVLNTADVSIRMVTIGERSWTTDLITGNWGDAPPEFGYNPSVLYDNQDGLGPVMGKLENPEITGSEEIDGRQATVVTGIVSSSVIEPLTAGTMAGDDVAITLWIDAETSDLLQVKVVEPEDSGKDDPATWTMRLSNFDEEVTIDPPVDES